MTQIKKSMKITHFILACSMISVMGCKSTKNNTTTTTAPAAPTVEDLVKAAQTKWPDVTALTITEGKDLYNTGACVNCHGPKKIANISEESLPKIIDNMAKKAKISDTQKEAVLKYALAVKLAGK